MSQTKKNILRVLKNKPRRLISDKKLDKEEQTFV